MVKSIKKVIFYLCIFSSFFTCAQKSKERTLPKNDAIKKITIYQEPKNRNDTLKPYLFVPSLSGKNDTIKNKAYYTYIRTSNVQTEFYIEDVPPVINSFWGEITKKDGFGFNGAVPLNSCILKSGKYKVIGRVYPRYGETGLDFHSYLQMEGYYQEATDWDHPYPMFDIEMPTETRGTHIGNYTRLYQGYPYFELQTEIEVEVPYELEGWSNSANLKEQEEESLKKELQERYNQIRILLAKKDTASLRQLVQEREDLLGTVYYLPEQEKEKRLQEFLDLVANDEFDIAPYPSEAQILFFAHGKMVTMVDPINREGVIRLVNKKDPKDIISLEFRFHRKKLGEKLSVI
ncbi:hypothetical protein ETU09_06035 [Apibacter muscae]|uniref:DUF4831 family protein n=1 Tax=Apibacter muscae TaxID=2509004 RepID=A0A563DE57_9FLAO|nr:hypothetical protein [Apibacter muscae]TWP28480.1 hypothetical protein ETU09_06035 [Apibacter muscae]